MRNLIREERISRLQKYVLKIERTDPPTHLTGRWAKTLIELYLGQLRAEDPEWPRSKLSANDLYRTSPNFLLHMYVHTPVQKRVEEALKKLSSKNYAGVKKVLEDLASNQAGLEIQSEIQRMHSAKSRKNHVYHTLLDKIFEENPAIGHRDTLRRLKQEVGNGVIKSINEQTDEIVLKNGSVFSTRGLKDQMLNRRRKK